MRRGIKLVWIGALALLLAGCQSQSGEESSLAKGTAAMEEGAYAEALTNFQNAESEEKSLLEVYRGEGIAFLGLGEYAQAVEAFDLALGETVEKQEKARKDILHYKASALYRQGETEETIAVCQQILEIEREADAYYLRGACYLEQQDLDRAQADFDAAVKMEPEDYDLFLNIYQCYQEQKLSARGAEYLQQALDIESDRPEDAYQKARIYYCMENYNGAQEQLEELVQEKDGDALILMGKIYLAQGENEQSATMYQQYLTEVGETAAAYNGLVLANLASDDVTAALENIQKGLALEGESGKQDLYYNEIVAYEHRGDFETAKEKAEIYVTAYPADELGQKEYSFLESR